MGARSRSGLGWARAALAAALLVLFAGTATAQVPSYFGTMERRHADMSAFTKWLRVLGQYSRDRAAAQAPCTASPCALQDWWAFVQSLRGLDRMSQLQRVHSYFNQYTYIEDPTNWGRDDYWEAPSEFLTRSGDCEDYAIIKYFSLRELGFADEDMRIVVILDTNVNLLHAVLVVRMSGVWYALDNRNRSVLPATSFHGFVPYYSINANAFWDHGG
jgi:predicted transglutaminase-like cysteine proteinase